MKESLYNEKELLDKFTPISLTEMDEVKLMNRTDTKFILNRTFFNQILPQLSDSYKVLEINNSRLASYKTLYYDTHSYQLFLDHHNEKGSRFKVRIRNYVESQLYFLEIKHKYKGRTNKNRIKVKDFEIALSEKSEDYISEILGQKISLVPKLWNSFQRITLVNKFERERLTLDLNLTFEWENILKSFENIVVAELKQENVNRNSLFFKLMKDNGVRPNSISKYCIGGLSLNPNLKQNNFKEKLIYLEKLN